MSSASPIQLLDLDLALLRLRRDAGDRWLSRHRPAAGHTRHLSALSQSIRHFASLRSRQGDDGPSEVERLLHEAARRVRERALQRAGAQSEKAAP